MNSVRSIKLEWLDGSTTVMIMARMLPIMITTTMAIIRRRPALTATA